jgi:hypothetical protein
MPEINFPGSHSLAVFARLQGQPAVQTQLRETHGITVFIYQAKDPRLGPLGRWRPARIVAGNGEGIQKHREKQAKDEH